MIIHIFVHIFTKDIDLQAFSKPVNVYVDTPLRDIVNRVSERVKRVGLLVRAVYPTFLACNILPALSTPFMVSPPTQSLLQFFKYLPSNHKCAGLTCKITTSCAALIILRQNFATHVACHLHYNGFQVFEKGCECLSHHTLGVQSESSLKI